MADPSSRTPQIIVLAGPNGAGKSTAATTLLPEALAFVNADEVAKRLPGYPSAAADWEAGRIVLEQMEELERQRLDFAVETTLSGRSLAKRIVRLKQQGYFFRLVFVWAPSPEFSIQRVAARVQAGGHAIPENTIRRRHGLSLRNFFQIYRPLADLWSVHENTSIQGFCIIAEGGIDQATTIHEPALWQRVQDQFNQGVSDD